MKDSLVTIEFIFCLLEKVMLLTGKLIKDSAD